VCPPVPRMTLERRHQGLELSPQLASHRHRERADHPDARELARRPVEAKQQRADRVVAGLVRPVAGHHAVRGALVLDLEHDPLIWLVKASGRLGDQPVEPGALELREPLPGHRGVCRRRREVDGRLDGGQGGFECGAALGERALGVVIGTEGQQVESDEVRRCLRGEQPHPARGRMQAQLQRLEVEPSGREVRQDDLAVDHAAWRQLGQRGINQLREVAGHRPLVPATELHLVAVAEHDGPEPVPLGLEDIISGRDPVYRLGQHRCHRGHHRKVHVPTCSQLVRVQPRPVHSELYFHSSSASSVVATRLASRAAHLS
jgi:hypothetical protein